MLDCIHMLLNYLITSYSVKSESFIIKLPSIYFPYRIFTFFFQSVNNLFCSFIIFHVKSTRKIVKFNFKLILSNWDIFFTWFIFFSFSERVIELCDFIFIAYFNSGYHAQKSKNNKIFHLILIKNFY